LSGVDGLGHSFVFDSFMIAIGFQGFVGSCSIQKKLPVSATEKSHGNIGHFMRV